MRDERDSQVRDIAHLIAEAFPTHPIPEYPPQMGIDPTGDDEYIPFANRPWTAVEPEHYASTTYDICPAIGFKLHDSPHMWNYFLPGFLTASLLFEREHDIVDAFMYSLREVAIPPSLPDPPSPWWGGSIPMENYTAEQRQVVTRALEFLRDFGEAEPIDYDWKRSDGRMLEGWREAPPSGGESRKT